MASYAQPSLGLLKIIIVVNLIHLLLYRRAPASRVGGQAGQGIDGGAGGVQRYIVLGDLPLTGGHVSSGSLVSSLVVSRQSNRGGHRRIDTCLKRKGILDCEHQVISGEW